MSASREPADVHLTATRAALNQMGRQIRRAERAKDCQRVLVAMFNAWRQRGIADAHLAALPWTEQTKRETKWDFERVHALTERWHRVYESKVFQCTRR